MVTLRFVAAVVAATVAVALVVAGADLAAELPHDDYRRHDLDRGVESEPTSAIERIGSGSARRNWKPQPARVSAAVRAARRLTRRPR